MSYKAVVAKACANKAALLTELWTFLSDIGWTLVDGNCTAVTVPYSDVNTTGETFTFVGHTFTNSMPVQISTSGTLPGGLSANTLYFIVGVSGNTFKLSTTYNGSAINLTSQGTGNHTIEEAFRVYSSTGEGADKIAEFLQIRLYASATAVVLAGYYSWSLTTHAGSGMSGGSLFSLVTAQTGFYAWLYGNKNLVYVVTKVSSTYTKTMAGHSTHFYASSTALTASATAGSNVTITVDSTANFKAGNTYQIVGANQEGRDDVVVSSITSTTQMVITTLPRNFSAGSLIGIQPSTFFVLSSAVQLAFTCPKAAVGLNAVSASYGVAAMSSTAMLFPAASVDPDHRSNEYPLFPGVLFSEVGAGSTATSIGTYLDPAVILVTGNVGIVLEDTLAVGILDSGTSSGSNSTSVFKNTAKSWTTNAYINKVLVVVFGTGQGQIKKIASNTSTELTLAAGWTFETTPDNTSQYVICDEGYRMISESVANSPSVLREGA
jgi:hypothetical protein